MGAQQRLPSTSKSPKTVLVVKFGNGEVIYESIAADTFAKTIRKLGMHRVQQLGKTVNKLPLISTQKSDVYSQVPIDSYWVMTHSSTEYKRQLLQEIASALDEKITVDVVPAA